jgi:hypothetical protein
MSTLKLAVEEADNEDIGHGIIRVERDSANDLKVEEGDLVAISGTKCTVARLMVCKDKGKHKGMVQADGLIRRNAGAVKGSFVDVAKTEVRDAERIMFAPTDVKLDVDDEFEKLVKKRFMHTAFVKGDMALLSLFGSALPMEVTRTVPDGTPVLVTDSTVISVLGHPATWNPPTTLDMKFLLRHDWLKIISSRISSRKERFTISGIDEEFQDENKMIERAKEKFEKSWEPIRATVSFYSENGALIGTLPWLSINEDGIKGIYPDANIPIYAEHREIQPKLPTRSSGLMTRCFKIGVEKCPKEINLSPRTVFVATPFSVDFQDSYKYAVRPALEEMGFNVWKADEHIGNIDIMCKMCQAIQECSYVVANISDWNANVLFEIGLAYGIGKKVIMVKNKTRSVPVDLSGLEYIDYESIDDLKRNLTTFFKSVDQS